MDIRITALLIFAATYAVVAFGRLPWSRLDRTGAALLGASLMVASGALSLDDAYRAVDFNTITLLLGMMIIVATLRVSGFFGLAAAWVEGHARRPLFLLGGIALVSALLSAFLVNDTICLMLTPLVAEMTLATRRNAVPYLIAVAMASNIGSVATITGNPQNIMIGSFSQIPYGHFVAAPAPRVPRRRQPAAPRGRGRMGCVAPRQVALRVRRPHRRLLLGCDARQGGNRGGRVAAADATGADRAHPARNRLAAAAALCRPLHRDVRRGEGAADARAATRGGRARSRQAAQPRNHRRRALEPRQQRAGRAGAEALHRRPRRSRQGVAHPRHGSDARRQFHHPGLDRQPHRRAARKAARHRHRFLGPFPHRRAGDNRHHRARRVVAELALRCDKGVEGGRDGR